MRSLSISFIGGGNMADALLAGLTRSGHPPERLLVVEPDAARARDLVARYGVRTAAPGTALPGEGLVVLAVKPQQAVTALQATPLPTDAVLLSIAAGLSVDYLRGCVGDGTTIVRCMPNTPARVGAGITGMWAPTQTSDSARKAADYVMACAGATVWLDSEAQIDAVTALSGSGPAYVFALAEAMAAAGVALGLPTDTAEKLAQHTCFGAGRLLVEDDASAAELRARVTSAGGTTAAALSVLDEGGFAALLGAAMTAARTRATELAADASAKAH